MNRYNLLTLALLLLGMIGGMHDAALAGASPAKRSENIRVLRIIDGYYQQDLFRKVADDDTDTGYAVMIKQPGDSKTGHSPVDLTGRPAVHCYIRDIAPGKYRVIFRLKIAEIPGKTVKVFSWDVHTGTAGILAAGSIDTAAFRQSRVYQNIEIPVVVPHGTDWIGPRLFWQGEITVWADSIIIVRDGTPVTGTSRNVRANEIAEPVRAVEPRTAEARIAHIPRVRKIMYRDTAKIFFRNIERTASHWLKQSDPYPNISEYVEHIKWLAYMHYLTGSQAYARTAAANIAQAHRLITGARKESQNARPRWQEVAPLYFIDKWLDNSSAYTPRHRVWVRNIALRAAPSFPSASVEYGAFNRAFLGAITGEALLRLVPDAPDADKWRQYKEQVWDYWWQYRDTDESSDHYNALWFRYLLQWVEMRGVEKQFWSDRGIKRLFERFLYQVFPAGVLPHYSDSPGWNTAWGHWVYLFEACATHFRDGRYKWAAHRIYDYSVNRIEDIGSWSYTGREAGWSLLSAYAVADDTIPEKPRDTDIALLTRHKIVQRSEGARKLSNQFFDLAAEQAPDKIVFYSGSGPDALSMMVDVAGAAGHGHAKPTALISLMDHQSVLLMSPGYTDREAEHHNIPILADYEGYPYDNTPYHVKSGNNLVEDVSVLELGSAAYSRIRVKNYQGYPASLEREIVFIKNAGVLVKDTLTPSVSLRARWSPVYRVRNAGPEHGTSWINTYLGGWIPVRGLGQNAEVVTRWLNNPRDLLIYFLPDPQVGLEVVDENRLDKTVPLPLRVQHTRRRQLEAGVSDTSTALLLPSRPGSAGYLAGKIRVLLDRPRQTVVEFTDDRGISNLVVLNSAASDIQAGDLVTNAEVACIRRRGMEIVSVAMLKGDYLKFAGRDLSAEAPRPLTSLVPPP